MYKRQFNDSFGVLNDLLARLGIVQGPVAWLGRPATAMVAMIVADTWKTTPFVALVVLAGLQGVPRSLIDAARIDGLSEWRIVLRIMLPLSKPAIATNVILSFIWSWNAFLWPLIVTRTQEMATLPLGLARFLSVLEDTTGALYAFVVMVLVPGITIFLMAQKEFIRGLTSGATKG